MGLKGQLPAVDGHVPVGYLARLPRSFCLTQDSLKIVGYHIFLIFLVAVVVKPTHTP